MIPADCMSKHVIVDYNLYLCSPDQVKDKQYSFILLTLTFKGAAKEVISHNFSVQMVSDAGFRMTEESSSYWFPWGSTSGSWPDDTANSTLHLCFFSEESDNATASDPAGLL